MVIFIFFADKQQAIVWERSLSFKIQERMLTDPAAITRLLSNDDETNLKAEAVKAFKETTV